MDASNTAKATAAAGHEERKEVPATAATTTTTTAVQTKEEEEKKFSSTNSNANSDDDDDGSSSSDAAVAAAEEVAENFHFESDEAAEAVRSAALKLYNAGDYAGALDGQYRVVRYFAEKHGATSAGACKYFLDYALSQLRLLQSASTIEDVLQPRDEDTMEACFINLEMARVGLQKRENAIEQQDVSNAAYVETQLMLAEVHNALAQLAVEKEDYDGALKEYEAELLVYRSLQQEEEEDGEEEGGEEGRKRARSSSSSVVDAGRVVGVLYGIAGCYMKEADFSGAEERLVATLDEIAKYKDGTISADIVEELKDTLEDAREMKGGKFREIQEEIDRQFVVQTADKVPTAQEFYVGASPKVMDGRGGETANPYVSAVPGGGSGAGAKEGSHLSMPLSAQGAVLGFAGEHHSSHNGGENSNSVSFFPPQQLSRSGPPATGAAGGEGSSGVTTVVARKKPKVPMGASPSASNSAPPPPPAEPQAKRTRTEE